MIIFADDADELLSSLLPSAEDIMKARLKTVGVEEYHFVMDNRPSSFHHYLAFAR